MRILFLTMVFDPEPTLKGLVFARELVRRGFEVEVVTGFPNYPGGRLYPGYRIRLLQREVVDGVRLTRLPLYPSHDGSALRRVATYVSIGFSFLVYGLLFARRPDVIYAYHPPLTVGVAAALLRILRRIPVVYDIQDLWPDTLRATGMLPSERLLGVVSRVCNWVYRHVDEIAVLSPGFKSALIERGVASEKISLIYNWCDEDLLTAGDIALPPGFPDATRFRVVFAGTMGKLQALDAVLEAAALLKATSPDVLFVLVGGGIEVQRLQARAQSMALTNVAFVGRVPMAQVGAVLQAADALLVHLKDDPLFEITVPSKIQAYMAVGKPIIIGVRGDAAHLVEAAGCGILALPENAESIAAAVNLLHRMSPEERAVMGSRGQRYYREHLSLDKGCEKFSDAFRTIAVTTPAR